jgi:hypothetical protein
MPLDDSEKERVRYHLGYPEVQPAASIQYGIPRPAQTAFLVELAMNNIIDAALPRVRSLLKIMDDIEAKLVDAQDRLAAIQLSDLKLREDEPAQLEREYVRWGMRLADIVGAPIYAYSTRYRIAMTSGSIPVRG